MVSEPSCECCGTTYSIKDISVDATRSKFEKGDLKDELDLLNDIEKLSEYVSNLGEFAQEFFDIQGCLTQIKPNIEKFYKLQTAGKLHQARNCYVEDLETITYLTARLFSKIALLLPQHSIPEIRQVFEQDRRFVEYNKIYFDTIVGNCEPMTGLKRLVNHIKQQTRGMDELQVIYPRIQYINNYLLTFTLTLYFIDKLDQFIFIFHHNDIFIKKPLIITTERTPKSDTTAIFEYLKCYRDDLFSDYKGLAADSVPTNRVPRSRRTGRRRMPR